MIIVFESLKEKRYCLVMVLLKLFLSEPEINVKGVMSWFACGPFLFLHGLLHLPLPPSSRSEM